MTRIRFEGLFGIICPKLSVQKGHPCVLNQYPFSDIPGQHPKNVTALRSFKTVFADTTPQNDFYPRPSAVAGGWPMKQGCKHFFGAKIGIPAAVGMASVASVGCNAESPLDVELWHNYFTNVVLDRPYVRLGAASVLETIGSIASDVIKEMLSSAEFLNEKNTRFVVIHMHEILPHGAQFLLELTNSNPTASEMADLVAGANKGTIMYMRMVDWALECDPLQNQFGQIGTCRQPLVSG